LENLTKSQNFIPDSPELGHKEPNRVQIGRKHISLEPTVVLHIFYVNILLINHT